MRPTLLDAFYYEEEDISLDPVEIGLLGFVGVLFCAYAVGYLIQQFLWLGQYFPVDRILSAAYIG